MIGTFTGLEVTIGGEAAGTVQYTSDTVSPTWTTTLSPTSTSDDWFSRLSINGGQYSGQAVTISWQLQNKTSGTTWSDVGTPAVTTSMSLDDGDQFVYATSNGLETGNYDWSVDVEVLGTYRVVATVSNSAP